MTEENEESSLLPEKKTEIHLLLLVSLLAGVGIAFVFHLQQLTGVLLLGLLLGAILLVSGVISSTWGIYAVAIYVPFLDFIVGRLPQGFQIPARFGLEAYLALVLLFLFIKNILLGREKFHWSGFIIPLGCFLLFSILSAIYNGTGFLPLCVAYYPLLRYFFLTYLLIINSDFRKEDAERLLAIMFIIVICQCLIAHIQYWGGMTISRHFRINPIEFGKIMLAKHRASGEAERYAFGTLGRYNILGMFLFIFASISFGLIITSRKKMLGLLLLLLILSALLLTYSRQSWLAFITAFPTILYIKTKRHNRLLIPIYTSSTILLTVLLLISIPHSEGDISPIKRAKKTFTEGYIQEASKNRLYYMRTFPIRLANAGLDKFLLGFGPGALGKRQAEMFEVTPLDVLGIPKEKQFLINDVAYAYILGQAGIVGLIAFIWLCVTMLIHSRSKTLPEAEKYPLLRSSMLCCPGIVAGFLISNLFGPNFEIRAMSVYIWLLLAFAYKFGGLAYAFEDNEESEEG